MNVVLSKDSERTCCNLHNNLRNFLDDLRLRLITVSNFIINYPELETVL